MKEFEPYLERLRVVHENLELWQKAKAEQQKIGGLYPMVYNNFQCNLKLPEQAPVLGVVNYRGQFNPNEPFGKNISGSSDKAKITLPVDFYRDFDKAVESSGNKKAIELLYEEYLSAQGEDKTVAYEALQKEFKPVYIELRLMGYNHQDITA